MHSVKCLLSPSSSSSSSPDGGLMWTMFQQRKFTDVALVCTKRPSHSQEDESKVKPSSITPVVATVPAHRCVLAAASVMFDGMFQLGSVQENTVELLEYEYEVVWAMLELLYKGSTEVQEAHLASLYKLCHLYRMQGLLDTLDHYFEGLICDETALQFYALGNLYSPPLATLTLEYIRQNAFRLFTNGEVVARNPLSAEEMCELLRDDHLFCDEMTVLSFMKAWAQTHAESYQQPTLTTQTVLRTRTPSFHTAASSSSCYVSHGVVTSSRRPSVGIDEFHPCGLPHLQRTSSSSSSMSSESESKSATSSPSAIPTDGGTPASDAGHGLPSLSPFALALAKLIPALRLVHIPQSVLLNEIAPLNVVPPEKICQALTKQQLPPQDLLLQDRPRQFQSHPMPSPSLNSPKTPSKAALKKPILIGNPTSTSCIYHWSIPIQKLRGDFFVSTVALPPHLVDLSVRYNPMDGYVGTYAIPKECPMALRMTWALLSRNLGAFKKQSVKHHWDKPAEFGISKFIEYATVQNETLIHLGEDSDQIKFEIEMELLAQCKLSGPIDSWSTPIHKHFSVIFDKEPNFEDDVNLTITAHSIDWLVQLDFDSKSVKSLTLSFKPWWASYLFCFFNYYLTIFPFNPASKRMEKKRNRAIFLNTQLGHPIDLDWPLADLKQANGSVELRFVFSRHSKFHL